MAPRRHNPHGTTSRQQVDQRRGTNTERGYSKAWSVASKRELTARIAREADTFCRYCKVEPATMMDHVDPPSRYGSPQSIEFRKRFWNRANWMPCCMRCNSEKSNMLPQEYRKRYPVKYERMVLAVERNGARLAETISASRSIKDDAAVVMRKAQCDSK